MIVEKIESYEKAGMSELSRFTFLLALKAQDALNVGPRMYNELKKVFISADSEHVHGFKEHTPECIQSHLLVSAMKTKDIRVR